MRRIRQKHRRGFTLLEVLATLMLMGIVLYPVLQGISFATAAAGEARHKVEAVSLAQSKLAELTAEYQLLSEAGSKSGAFPDFPAYTWTSLIEMRDTNLSQITVRVAWVARGQERHVELSSMIYTADTSGATTSGATAGTGTGTGTR